MKRNFYQRIYDNLNCNRELYQQFVNKYNIKPSKYKFNIFENKLKYIEFSGIDLIDIIKKLLEIPEDKIEQVLEFIDSLTSSEYKDNILKCEDYNIFLDEKINQLFDKYFYLSINIDYINLIIKNDLFNYFRKFIPDIEPSQFCKFCEELSYDTNKLNDIFDKVSNVEEFKKLNSQVLQTIYNKKIPNPSLLIEIYIHNNEFREFVNQNYNNSNFFLIIENFNELNNISFIKEMFMLVNNNFSLSGIQLDTNELIKILKVDNEFLDDFKNIVNNQLHKNGCSELFKKFGLPEELKFFKNSSKFFNYYFYSLDNIFELKILFKRIFPSIENLLKMSYEEINDSYIKNCYDISKRIFESDDIILVKNEIIKFNQECDIVERAIRIKDYVVQYNYNEFAKNISKTSNFEQLRTSFLEVGDRKIPLHFLEGQDFNFIIHKITKPNISASYFRTERNNAISLSVVHERHNNIFGGSLTELNGNLVLGFDDLPLNEISSANPVNGGTGSSILSDKLSLSNSSDLLQLLNREIMLKEHNEIQATRSSKQSGEVRLPKFILVNKISLINSRQVEWALEYGIPIIVIDSKKYQERFENEFRMEFEKYKSITNFEEKLISMKRMGHSIESALLWGDISLTVEEKTFFLDEFAYILDNLSIENVEMVINLLITYQNNGKNYISKTTNRNSEFFKYLISKTPDIEVIINRLRENCHEILSNLKESEIEETRGISR